MLTDDTPKSDSRNPARARVVALTGGIGSGKSSARKLFASLGVPCLDADLIARDIHQYPGHPAMAAIAAAIPASVATDGTLRRGSLRDLFAVDKAANSALKHILKPYVMAEAQRWTRAQGARYVVWESALIADEAVDCDRVLVADASDSIRLARVRQRNLDWSAEQIGAIMAVQLSRAAYLARADDVITNDGTPEELRAQVEQLHRHYLAYWS